MSDLDTNDLIAFSTSFSNLAIQLPNKPKFNNLRNDLNDLASRFSVQATANFLNDLDDAASNLQRVTDKIQSAIKKIKETDEILGKTADIVTAIGNLARGIQGADSAATGKAIDELLDTSGL
jgi:hypothetical protein